MILFYRNTEEYQKCAIYKQYYEKKDGDIKADEHAICKEARHFQEYLAVTAQYARANNNPNFKPEELLVVQNKKEVVYKKVAELGLTEDFRKIAPYSGYMDVIGDRSYGDDPEIVAKMAQLYIDAASKEDILCVPKHALGHGSPLQDTHAAKAFTDAIKEELIDVNLAPYKELFRKIICYRSLCLRM